MLEAIFIPFSAIFIAELLDKSQLTVLLLSTKTKKHLQLLIGVFLAFLIVDGLAIFFGSFISTFLDPFVMRIIAGGLFIIFGILSLRASQDETKTEQQLRNPFLSGFTFVFFSEWGDKTQIASAVFASQYPTIPVLIGVMAALFLLSVIAITVGAKILNKIKKQTVSRISGIVFILLGIFFLLSK